MDLRGSTVVVTGASSGIGRATALLLAERGANVVVAARRANPLEEVAAECVAHGVGALAVPTDVADPVAVEALANAAVERFGRIDGWVNAAGVSLIGPFEALPPDAFRRTVDVDFFGVVHGSRAALRELRRSGGGAIVNVASVAGRVGAPYYTAYSAAKHAVVGFSQSLRMELRSDRSIAVCTVLPAAIDTPFFEHSGNYRGRPYKPVRPFYTADDVARTIASVLEHPRGEVFVGGVARPATWVRSLVPPLFEAAYAAIVERDHFLDQPAPPTPGNVFEPVPYGTTVDGGWSQREAPLATVANVALTATAAAVLLGVVRLLAGRVRGPGGR